MLERATLLRGARRFGTALAQRRFGRRQFLQRSDSGSRRICPSSEEFRASDACEAQPAFAASCALVSAGGKELIGLRSATSWIGCRSALRAFAYIHRSNRRLRLQNESMVAGNRAEAKASVTTGLRAGFPYARTVPLLQYIYLVKISFVPAIRRTVAKKSEITRTAKRLLPKCEPAMPPMIAAAARIKPSEGIERTFVK